MSVRPNKATERNVQLQYLQSLVKASVGGVPGAEANKPPTRSGAGSAADRLLGERLSHAAASVVAAGNLDWSQGATVSSGRGVGWSRRDWSRARRSFGLRESWISPTRQCWASFSGNWP